MDANTERLFGVRPGDFGGGWGDLLERLSPDDRRTADLRLEQAVSRRGEFFVDAYASWPGGGRRGVQMRGSPIYDGDGVAVRVEGAVWDATELLELKGELERSNALLAEFAYAASHDLKAPLRGISGYAALLERRYGEQLGPEGARMLDHLTNLSRQLDDRVSHLLRLSKIGASDLELADVDLGELLRTRVLPAIQWVLDESEFEVRVPRPLPTLRCDPVLTADVLQNLLVNAARYSDKTERFAEVGATRGDPPVLHVRDNGLGIAPTDQERVFEVFRRLHAEGEYGGGSGAGLTLARRIVERHGGRMWVESVPGEGTSFYFTLSAGG